MAKKKLTKQEQAFLDSIKSKISKYGIKTSIKNVLTKSKNQFIMSEYNDKKNEIIEINCEWYLCKLSFYYFVDKYGWVSHPIKGIIPFKQFYVQKHVIKEFKKNRFNIFLKSRQVGISTISANYALWFANFNESKFVDIISVKKEKAKEFMDKCKITYNRLPKYLQVPSKNDNLTELMLTNESKLLVEASGENAGRGSGVSLLIIDEAGFIDKIKRIWTSAYPTLTTGGDAIIISTPNGTSGTGEWFYKQWQKSIHGGNLSKSKKNLITIKFNPIFIHWFEVPGRGLDDLLKKYSEKKYRENPEIFEQFKKEAEKTIPTNAWYQTTLANQGLKEFRQEYLCDFIISGQLVLSQEKLDDIRLKCKRPKYQNEIAGIKMPNLWVWKTPIAKHKYIMGVDVASGGSDDYSAFQIINLNTMEQVAEYKGFISTKKYSNKLKEIARLYNDAFIAIEGTGLGQAVFDGVLKTEINPYYNILKTLKSKNEIKEWYAWQTTSKTRPLVIDELLNHVNDEENKLEHRLKIYSERLLEEFNTLIFNNNRIEAAKECNDDALFALGLALYHKNEAKYFSTNMIGLDGELIEFEEGEVDIDYSNPIDDDWTTVYDPGIDEIFEKETGLNLKEYKKVLN